MIWPLRPAFALLTAALFAFASGCKKQQDEPTNDGATTNVPEVPEVAAIEKSVLTLGIVANSHAAPIVVGQSQGTFTEQKLEITPQVFPDYEGVLAGILNGSLDGGMLPPGMVLNAVLSDPAQRLIVPCVLSRNGSTIAVTSKIWESMSPDLLTDGQAETLLPITSDALNLVVQSAASKGTPLAFAVESAYSSANYLLRYWLAANGIYPGVTVGAGQVMPSHTLLRNATVDIMTVRPSELAAGLADSLAGSAYSEPGNRLESHITVITAHDILKNHPSAVLAVGADWATEHPVTLQALIRGVCAAATWLDGNLENRRTAASDLAGFLGIDPRNFTQALTGSLTLADSITTTSPDHQVFARYQATAPDAAHATWTLTQIVRWGQVAGNHPDSWYQEVIGQVYRRDLYEAAMGKQPDDSTISDFIDGQEFNMQAPNAYLKSAQIGLQ